MRPLYRLNDEASKGPRRAHACLHAQSCLTLCDPIGCSLPGSSVHGILQARILEWVAISYFRGSCPSRDRTHLFCVSCIDRWILYHWAPRDPTKSKKDVITAEWASEWVKSLSRVWLFATPWTLARQVPLSMGFSRQEYWSGLPFPSPGDLPDPGTEPRSLHCGQTLYCLSQQGSPSQAEGPANVKTLLEEWATGMWPGMQGWNGQVVRDAGGGWKVG